MRKLFWCSVAVAVAAAGGVYLASKSVEHSPTVALGQTLVDLGSGEESAVNGPGREPLFPEPTPVNEQTGIGEEPKSEVISDVVAVTDPSRPGHIIIDDMDPQSPQGAVPLTTTRVAIPAPPPAPTAMPYCGDEEEGGAKQMPYAEGDESEPQADAIDSIWSLLREVAREAAAQPMSDAEEANQDGNQTEDNCPEDGGHEGYQNHHHEMVCPYTGRSYPSYPVAPSAPEPMPEQTPKNNNEKKDPEMSESRKTSPPELDDEAGEEQEWPVYRLDTMEFRPSDAGFQPILTRPF